MKTNKFNTAFFILTILFPLFYITAFSQYPADTMAIEKWSKPELIWSIYNDGGGSSPTISWDGNTIYYNKSLSYGPIYKVTKNDTGWSQPIRLSNNINGIEYISKAVISPNGKILYFNAGLNPRIYRSYWDSVSGDWTPGAIFYDNGININNPIWASMWEVSNFFNDTLMVLMADNEGFITQFSKLTGLWGAPVDFVSLYAKLYDTDGQGGWAAIDTSRYYYSKTNYTINSSDIYVRYIISKTELSWPKRLNICYESDTLY
jgi:hypothetical protein